MSITLSKIIPGPVDKYLSPPLLYASIKVMPKTKINTPKHTKYQPAEFVDRYIANGRNAKRAIQSINPELTPGAAEVQASRMLGDAKVQQLLNDWQDRLRDHVQAAINTTANIMNNKANKPGDRLAAARDIMDRAGLKPIDKKASVKLNIEQFID